MDQMCENYIGKTKYSRDFVPPFEPVIFKCKLQTTSPKNWDVPALSLKSPKFTLLNLSFCEVLF